MWCAPCGAQAEAQRAEKLAKELEGATFMPEITRLAAALWAGDDLDAQPAWQRLSANKRSKMLDRIREMKAAKELHEVRGSALLGWDGMGLCAGCGCGMDGVRQCAQAGARSRVAGAGSPTPLWPGGLRRRVTSQLKECTFRPRINKQSAALMADRTMAQQALNLSAHEQLFADAMRRQQKMETLQVRHQAQRHLHSTRRVHRRTASLARGQACSCTLQRACALPLLTRTQAWLPEEATFKPSINKSHAAEVALGRSLEALGIRATSRLGPGAGGGSTADGSPVHVVDRLYLSMEKVRAGVHAERVLAALRGATGSGGVFSGLALAQRGEAQFASLPGVVLLPADQGQAGGEARRAARQRGPRHGPPAVPARGGPRPARARRCDGRRRGAQPLGPAHRRVPVRAGPRGAEAARRRAAGREGGRARRRVQAALHR